MELRRTFDLAAGADAAFDAISDLGWALPCVPGASLLGADGDGQRVRLALRVADRRREYEGTVTLAERDLNGRTVRLDVHGRDLDSRDVAATVTATVVEVGPRRSQVELRTQLDDPVGADDDGRSPVATAAQRLVDQFAYNLDASLAAGVEHDRPATESSPTDRTLTPVPAAPAAALEDDAAATSRSRPWGIALAVIVAVVVGVAVGRLSQTAPARTPASGRRRRRGGRGS